MDSCNSSPYYSRFNCNIKIKGSVIDHLLQFLPFQNQKQNTKLRGMKELSQGHTALNTRQDTVAFFKYSKKENSFLPRDKISGKSQRKQCEEDMPNNLSVPPLIWLPQLPLSPYFCIEAHLKNQSQLYVLTQARSIAITLGVVCTGDELHALWFGHMVDILPEADPDL